MGMKIGQFISIGVLVLVIAMLFIIFKTVENVDVASSSGNVTTFLGSAATALAVVGSLLVLIVLALIFPMVIGAFKKMGGGKR